MTDAAPPDASHGRCSGCGSAVSGRFCRQCGAPAIAASACVRCGHALGEGGRFCPGCGTAAIPRSGGSLTGNERLTWFMAGGVTMALIGAVILAVRNPATVVDPEIAAPFAAGVPTGAAPDISSLSPRERFDRLFNRVMRAAETGDEATVSTFAPMALGAYAMLDQVDADARYHAALIDLHTGNIEGAAALADSILTMDPGHLFGYVVRGTIARFQKNGPVLRQASRDFLQHDAAEMKRGRPEYADHPKALEEFRAAAVVAGARDR